MIKNEHGWRFIHLFGVSERTVRSGTRNGSYDIHAAPSQRSVERVIRRNFNGQAARMSSTLRQKVSSFSAALDAAAVSCNGLQSWNVPDINFWNKWLTGGENGRQIEIVIGELGKCHGDQGQLAVWAVEVGNQRLTHQSGTRQRRTVNGSTRFVHACRHQILNRKSMITFVSLCRMSPVRTNF